MSPRLAFGLLLLAFVVLAFGYSVTVPLGESSDEVSHWSYVQYLAAHWELPKPEGAVLGEAHQPPLYYLLGALATFWLEPQGLEPIANPDFILDDPQTPNVLLHPRGEGFPYQGPVLAWHLVRLLSIAMAAVTVCATWRIARRVLAGTPQTEWMALAAAGFVAFLPGFLFISSVVNNDNLVVMLSSVAVLQTLDVARAPTDRRAAALLGLLLGLGLLAKLSGLVVWIFVGAVLFYTAVRSGRWSERARQAAVIFGLALLIVFPWVLSNFARYGDPLGWSLLAAVTPNRQSAMTLGDWEWFLKGLYTSFWGRFGGVVHIRMPNVLYIAYGAMMLLGLGGWIGHARDARRGQLGVGVASVAGLFGLFWTILLTAHLRWTLTILGTDQARQLFPGLPLFAIFLAAGLARLSLTRPQVILGAWAGASALVGITMLVYLQSIFAAPVQNVSTLKPLGENRAADFGEMIRVLDYRLDRTSIEQGGSFTVEVYWAALSDVPEQYWALFQLAGKGEPVLNKDATPSAGRLTTDWWRKGQVYSSRHRIVIPVDTPSGSYLLRLGLHPFAGWDWLAVRGREMLDLANVNIIGPAQ